MTLQTSSVGNDLDRLTLRHSLIIEANSFTNHSVLDLGSHNDRWGEAVIQAGARSVTAVDRITMPSDSALIQHHQQDCHSFLIDAQDEYDSILCLGLLYHTHDPIGLFRAMMSLKPKQIIVDTDVSLREENIIEVIKDQYEATRTDAPQGDLLEVYRCVMTDQLIHQLATSLGGHCEEITVNQYPESEDCMDYRLGYRRVYRITMV